MGLIKSFRIKNFKTKNHVAKFENVSFSYGKRQILDKININLNSGEIIGLLGPNGAGKSSIFNLLIGLLNPSYGKILIEGNCVNDEPVYVRSKKYKIGYVPQFGGYFGDLTLLENLKIAAELLIEKENDRQKKINDVLGKFELDNVQHIKSKFLSGGQRRKLVICMALLGNPKILLCDEIFAALDVLTIQMLKKILVTLQKENPQICILICEHQARELLSVVDRALILSESKIIAEGSPNSLINNEKAKSHYFGNFY